MLHIFHCACAKRPYFHFRSKIWRRHRVPRPRFPRRRGNFGDFDHVHVCLNSRQSEYVVSQETHNAGLHSTVNCHRLQHQSVIYHLPNYLFKWVYEAVHQLQKKLFFRCLQAL